MLIKDNRTGKKSVTVTCLVVSITMAWFCLGVNLYCLIVGRETNSALVWAAVGLASPFIALYWNKRVKAGADGLTLESECERDRDAT